jgi:hypothetical protein
MSFIRLYARVLGLLGPEKRLAAGLALVNVALAVSQFAEPMLFGKVIHQLTDRSRLRPCLDGPPSARGLRPGRRSASSPSWPG